MLFDYSKNLINEEIMKSLFDLARAAKVDEMKQKMFNGEKINFTEDRAVFHVALRHQGILIFILTYFQSILKAKK